jgi:pyrroloquinoline quinone biosynthesis protein D
MGAIAKRKDCFVETEIDDELVVMELDQGEFFSLTGTAIAIWRLIDGTRDRAALVAALTEEFAAPQGEIAADVDELLARLNDAGLISAG